MEQSVVVVAAIITVGVLGCVAIVSGVDGPILVGAIAIVGGLGGYSVREAVLQYRAVRGGQKLP